MSNVIEYYTTYFAMRYMVIAVDGGIGAGKTALCELLEQRLGDEIHAHIELIPEPVDIWKDSGLLSEFYKDIHGVAYPFQTVTFSTRAIITAKTILGSLLASPDTPIDTPTIFISERSVATDRYVFGEMLREHFTAVQWLAYLTCYNQWQQMLCTLGICTSAHIYVEPPVDMMMDRIRTRGRSGEIVSREYQEALVGQHKKVFGGRDSSGESGDELFMGLPDTSVAMIDDIKTPVLHVTTKRDFRIGNGGDTELVKKIAKFYEALSLSKSPQLTSKQ